MSTQTDKRMSITNVLMPTVRRRPRVVRQAGPWKQPTPAPSTYPLGGWGESFAERQAAQVSKHSAGPDLSRDRGNECYRSHGIEFSTKG